MVQLPQPHEALHRVIFRDLREWSSAGLSQHLATFSTCNATGEDWSTLGKTTVAIAGTGQSVSLFFQEGFDPAKLRGLGA